MATRATIAASVNQLIRLESSEQSALLEVIEDYFCPTNPPDQDQDSEDSEDEAPNSPGPSGV